MARMTKAEKEFRHKVQVVARVVMLTAFGLLVLFAITQTARMLSVVQIEHDNGVPRQWAHLLSDANPETITVPISYYDQRSEECGLPAAERQFEYTRCDIFGVLAPGLVRNRLGVDGKPVPTFATAVAAAGQRVENRGMWGENFKRWFNEVPGKSERVDKTITFTRQGEGNIYMYGGEQVFPLDGYPFSDGDYNAGEPHNFHFTAMTAFPFEVQLSGKERWEFEGDDDVWVFINDRLVLDIGGLHTVIKGYFEINKDGTVTTNVNGKTGRVDLGLKEGEVAHLSFFYAERSTSHANCKITIREMVWPIRAAATIEAETVNNQWLRYTSSITNSDPVNPLEVTHLASFLNAGESFDAGGFGFLPLANGSLRFTWTPEDENSWQPVEINAPRSSADGSQLATPILLAPNGQNHDTAYFMYKVAPERQEGAYFNTITYKTRLNGAESLARAADYSGFTGLGDPDDGYLDPLGESDEIDPGDGSKTHDGDLFAPGSGIADAAAVILSQWFLLGTLVVFGASFAIYYPNRNF